MELIQNIWTRFGFRGNPFNARFHRLHLPAPTCLRAETHRQGLRQAGGLIKDEIKLVEESVSAKASA